MQNVRSEIAAYRQSNSVVSVPEQRTSERNIGPLPRPYTELVVVVVTVTPVKGIGYSTVYSDSEVSVLHAAMNHMKSDPLSGKKT